MSLRMDKLELVERYCTGLLSPVELSIFEQWLSNDPELVREVDEYRKLTGVLEAYSRRQDLKKRVAELDAEMESDQFRFHASLKKVAEGEQSRYDGMDGLIRKYRWRLVAAAISVLLISAAIGLFGIYGAGGGKTQSAYQELRREVETIKRKQNALLSGKTLTKKDEAAAPALKTYMGTGVAIDKQGYLLTSHHVVSDAKSVHVTNVSGEPWKARVVYTNAELDLAVLLVEDAGFKGFSDMPFAMLRTEADPGEKVYTLGFPREDMVFGEGSVSSRTGFEGDSSSYQISIPVNPGNSGGPLFDNEGNLLGIISGRNTSAEGASFAVKSSRIATDLQASADLKLGLPKRKALRGLERTRQVKKISEFVFMVHVTN
ncbi:MAG: hypothetical protein RLZZ630_505 [Bacteroidota bacterium]